jgi:hypothetical protein
MSYIKADNEREQEYFDFLEDLRQSGDTNMFGASPYLSATFGLGKERAKEVLSKWMKFHDEPARILSKPRTKTKRTCKLVTEAHVESSKR